jgi:microcystin-dependent protein
MKSKLLFLLSFILCVTASNYAQVSATQAGIAVQGIARDANNTAIASRNISLTFTLYYLDASSIEQKIYEKDENLMTDTFGIFSYVIDPTAANNSKFANNVAYLRIKNGQVLISDEKLRHVPYAISASNGVPTGSIMPFIGTTAPQGWVICNGQSLVAIPGAADLIALLGSNTAPNLLGMFLRGTGTGTNSSHAGPALKAIQEDAIESHSLTVTDPGHNHNITDPGHTHGIRTASSDSNGNSNDYGDNHARTNATESSTTGITINSKTTGISVNYSGAAETRPVNYGVNYIIKL